MKTFIKNNNYDAIVFDLDGTLYHKSYYVSLYYDFTKNTLEKLLSISPEDIDSLLKSHNISRDYREEQGSVTDLITQLGISLDTWNKHRETSMDISSALAENPEISLTIRKLHENYKTGLITNSTKQLTEQILRKIGVDPKHFDVVITSDSGLKPKPSSEPYQYVSNELGVPPNKIIAIGDRYNVDIKPLINLGGDGVLVDSPDEVCDFAARFLYDDQKRIAENTAVILWSRLPDQNFSAKTRIGTAINNQNLANQLALCLTNIAVDNATHADVAIFLYHQNLQGSEKISSSNIIHYFGENFIDEFSYDESRPWMLNVRLSIEKLFQLGFTKGIMMVSDCPYFDNKRIMEMIKMLDEYNVVLNPATDKGINAIGVNINTSLSFIDATNVTSHTEGFNMCEEMTTNLAKEGISFQLMSPPLSDIDNLDDLISLWHWLLTKNKLSKYEETLLLLLEKNKGVLGLSIDQ